MSCPGVGNHVLRAVATDTSGATGSHEITVTVAQGQAPSSVSRQYVYDAQQRLCKVIEPETASTVMSYDDAGNLAWSASGLNLPSPSQCDLAAAQSSGRRVDRVYDSRNRRAQLRFPDRNGDHDWEYTADGLPTRVVTWNDGGASTVNNTYAYNKRGMLISESASVDGGAALTADYVYNGIGAVSSQARPGNLTLSYTPNALGQPTRIAQTGQVYAQAITYHPNGALASLHYGNGVAHQSTLNARQLPSRLSDGTISTLDYQYDHNANTTAILDLVQGTSRNVHMQYDARDRLVQASSPGFGGDGQHRYRYDVLDNLISSHLGEVKEHNYWYDARNRLTNVRNDQGAATIGLNYDVQGNLATRNGVVHSCNFGNRLRSANGVERYRYDAHGRRVAAIDGQGTRVDSLYGSTDTLVYENRRDGGGATHYIHLGKRLLAVRKGNTTTWQHVDALGTPVATSNASGALVERKQYTPYGGSIGAATDGVGYTGHVMDAATGLTYMQQRYMDPELGMFLSVDPVSAYEQPVGQFNRYRYGNGNPYKFTDPDGQESCDNMSRLCRYAVTPSSTARAEVPKASSGAEGSIKPGQESSDKRWDDRKGRLGLKGDLTKNGNILDIGSLAHDIFHPLMDSPGGSGVKAASIGLLAVTLRAEGKVVFKTGHYNSRLAAAGLNVHRTESTVGREVTRIIPNIATNVDVVGRMRVNGTLIEYMVRKLPGGIINVGSIFPVK